MAEPDRWRKETDNLCEALETLQPDDTITINDNPQSLTVIKADTIYLNTNAYRTYCVWLSGDRNGNVYRIQGTRYYDNSRSPDTDIPLVIEKREEQEWSPEPYDVTTIKRIDSSTQLISTLTATDYLQGINTAGKRTVDTPQTDAPFNLGEQSCPDCGGRVTKDTTELEPRIVCTDCGKWCWKRAWDAYYDD